MKSVNNWANSRHNAYIDMAYISIRPASASPSHKGVIFILHISHFRWIVRVT